MTIKRVVSLIQMKSIELLLHFPLLRFLSHWEGKIFEHKKVILSSVCEQTNKIFQLVSSICCFHWNYFTCPFLNFLAIVVPLSLFPSLVKIPLHLILDSCPWPICNRLPCWFGSFWKVVWSLHFHLSKSLTTKLFFS